MEDIGKRLIEALIADFEDPSHRGAFTKAVYKEMVEMEMFPGGVLPEPKPEPDVIPPNSENPPGDPIAELQAAMFSKIEKE